ncbi:hypothetical protein PtA15_13A184 [Puccinia triticina]|nr:uncharacterized protein PtA15_13A184 [Puccinia triticina]WAQ90785.1 hypothetical protein PtA15_13A184 [Puccinia triticina]WAR60971.1 hypothetical protein PtB15_13B222 [Puccinia triticina]
MDDLLDLDAIRRILMRLEDTITFLMIERAQFAHNRAIYESSGAFTGLQTESNERSFLGWMLRETERTHAKVRRYEAPDEYPFTPPDELPRPILPLLRLPPTVLHPNPININPRILHFYIHNIVPVLTQRDGRSDDDGQYGSAATRDVEILQAVSRRIHYGKFVAESKFRAHPEAFVGHIRARDRAALEGLITKPAVEVALIERLAKKALTYGQEISEGDGPAAHHKGAEVTHKMDAKVVVEMYKNWVIPLTREVEVEYLLCRLDGLSEEELAQLDSN